MPVIDLSQDPDSGSVAGPSEDGNAAAGPSRRSAGRNPSNSLRAEPSSDNDVELVSASQPSRASSPPVRSYTRRSQRLRESRQSSQGGLHLPDVPNYSFVNLADTQEEPVALGNNIGSAPSGGTERSWLSRISDTIRIRLPQLLIG